MFKASIEQPMPGREEVEGKRYYSLTAQSGERMVRMTPYKNGPTPGRSSDVDAVTWFAMFLHAWRAGDSKAADDAQARLRRLGVSVEIESRSEAKSAGTRDGHQDPSDQREGGETT